MENNYLLEKEVFCQFPMIHFQEKCDYKIGLRASDIKPRLDRYLREVIGDEKLKQYFKNDTKSLDYKLFIHSFPDAKNDFELCFDKNGKIVKKKEVFYYGDYSKLHFFNCKLKFICFHEGLTKIINENISDFFLLNNFGIMQSKGYGSFTVGKYESNLNETDIKEIGKVLKKFTGNAVYYFKLECDYNKSKFYSKVSNVIKNYYNVLKHGNNYDGKGKQKDKYIRSFIYEYAHEKNMNNEKAMMKVFNISPNISENGQKKVSFTKNDKYFYVRGLLGLTGLIRYKAGFDEKQGKNTWEKIEIKPIDSNIKRIPSPIKFKVIGNVIFVYNYNVSKYILNKEFEFKNEENKSNKKINTPEQFNISELLYKYNQKYNTDFLRKIYGEIIEEYKIKEVKSDE